MRNFSDQEHLRRRQELTRQVLELFNGRPEQPGISTTAIAARLGISETEVCELLQAAGWGR